MEREKTTYINSSAVRIIQTFISKLDAFLSNDDIYGAPAVFELLHIYSIFSAILCVCVLFNVFIIRGLQRYGLVTLSV